MKIKQINNILFINRIIITFFIFVISIFIAFGKCHAANSWDPLTGVLVIQDPLSGTLNAAIDDALGGSPNYDKLKQLTVTASATSGAHKLTEADITFLGPAANGTSKRFPNLEVLNLAETTTSGNLSLSNNFMYQHASIAEVKMPFGVEIIGMNAFHECNALTDISIPGATSIGFSAFEACGNLINVSAPLIQRLFGRAFTNCSKLLKIYMPNATTLGGNVFQGCTQLTDLTLSPQIGAIGSSAFENCKNLKSVYFPEVSYIGDSAFASCIRLTSADLPKTQSISNFAFSGCTGLQTLHFPNATSVGDGAFTYCSYLRELQLPQVQSISALAFTGCSNLQKLTLFNTTSLGSFAFQFCSALTALTLPQVTGLPHNVFLDCSGLTSLNLPLVQTIDYNAFKGCSDLTSLSLPQATLIGSEAFQNCSSLTNQSLPLAGEIKYNAFRYCTRIQAINLPAATNLGSTVFRNCPNLKYILLGNSAPPQIVSNTFNLAPADLSILVRAGTKSAYASNPQWQQYGRLSAVREIRATGVIPDFFQDRTLYIGETLHVKADTQPGGEPVFFEFTDFPPIAALSVDYNASGTTASFTPLQNEGQTTVTVRVLRQDGALINRTFRLNVMPKPEPNPPTPSPTPSGTLPKVAYYWSLKNQNVEFTLLGAAGLHIQKEDFGMRVNGVFLRRGSDYSVAGKKVILHTLWLRTLPEGTYTVQFMKKTTLLTWAKLIVTETGDNPNNGTSSGGCNTGMGLGVLLMAAGLLITRFFPIRRR